MTLHGSQLYCNAVSRECRIWDSCGICLRWFGM